MAPYAVKETIKLIDRSILGMTVQFESCICTLDSEAGRKSDGVKKHYPGKIAYFIEGISLSRHKWGFCILQEVLH